MRYLAIDYGAKRTGLAICDATETITSPFEVVNGQKELLKRITQIVEAEGVGAIVLGLPLNMDDSRGSQAKLVLKFAKQLEKQLDIPIHLQDERLSTFSAGERLNATNLSANRWQKRLDAVAAAEILEAFLEQKRSGEDLNNEP